MQCEKCGAALDSKGRCTACGAKQPKSKGYVIGHSIVCCILTVILTFSLLGVGIGRSLIHSDLFPEVIEKTNIATFPVGAFVDSSDLKQTLAEYLHEEYVTDTHITVEEVENMVESLGVEKLLLDKTNAYLALLRGDSDEMVTLKPEEITTLLETKKDTIFETLSIRVKDADLQTLTEKLEDPCDDWNRNMDRNYGSKLARSVSRFESSLACFALFLIFILALMIRWCVVYRRGRGRAPQGLRASAITVLVCAAMVLIGGIACLICSASLADEFTSLIDLTHGIGTRLALFGGVALLASVFLLILSNLLLMMGRKTPVTNTEAENIEHSSVMQEIQVDPTPASNDLTGPYGAPTVPEAPIAPTPSTPAAAPAETPAALRKEEPALAVCPSCGTQATRPTQKFCMSCGTSLTTPPPAPTVSLAKSDAAGSDNA